MISDRIAGLEQVVAAGARELQPELDALKAIAQSLSKSRIPAEEISRLGAESFAALIEEFSVKPDPARLILLLCSGLDKEKHKMVKRALHRLKSRGVEVPEPAVEGPKAASPSAILKEWARATPAMLLTGEQLFYYFASGTMGTQFLISPLNSEAGILDAKIFSISEKQALRIIAEGKLASGTPVPAMAIPKEHFLRAISRARARTKNPEFKRGVESFLEKFRLETTGRDDPGSPVWKSPDPDQLGPGPIREDQIGLLLEHNFFKFWEFDHETIKACGEELKEVEQGLIQIGDSQLSDRLARIFEKHSQGGLEKNLARIQYGLRENAYLLELQGETEAAEAALKLALSLDLPNQSGDFFFKLLLRTFPEAEKKLGKKPGGLIIPGR